MVNGWLLSKRLSCSGEMEKKPSRRRTGLVKKIQVNANERVALEYWKKRLAAHACCSLLFSFLFDGP